MSKFASYLAIPAAALAVLASGPALAAGSVDARCIWAAAPQSVRDGALTADPSPTHIHQVLGAIDADAVAAMARRCGMPVTRPASLVISRVVTGKVTQIWALTQLESRYGVTSEAVSAAWLAQPAPDRARFAKVVSSPTEADGLAAKQTAFDILSRLSLYDQDALGIVVWYGIGRATLEGTGAEGLAGD